MRKKIFASAMLMAITQHSVAEDKQQRIPLVVDSSYQPPSVLANFPETHAPQIKLIEPIPNKAPENQAEKKAENKDRDRCIDDASRRPTDAGVRLALSECYRKHGK